MEKAYDKQISKYREFNLPGALVKKFGINPGWNAVIGTYGCCGVAMSFHDNNPHYGDESGTSGS